MNILILDTADNKKITVGLIIDGEKDIQTKEITSNKTQIILPMIDKILSKHPLKPKDLSEIQVNAGPGSFTGLRVGAAIGSMLATLLGVPLNGKPPGTPIEPQYDDGGKFS